MLYLYISSWKLCYIGYKSATEFMDDAQQRTIAVMNYKNQIMII